MSEVRSLVLLYPSVHFWENGVRQLFSQNVISLTRKCVLQQFHNCVGGLNNSSVFFWTANLSCCAGDRRRLHRQILQLWNWRHCFLFDRRRVVVLGRRPCGAMTTGSCGGRGIRDIASAFVCFFPSLCIIVHWYRSNSKAQGPRRPVGSCVTSSLRRLRNGR